MRKGFALDDERLKNLGGGGYFKENFRHRLPMNGIMNFVLNLLKKLNGYFRFWIIVNACGINLLTKWQNYFREINQQFQGILKIFIQKKNLCRKQLLHILQQFKMKETGR